MSDKPACRNDIATQFEEQFLVTVLASHKARLKAKYSERCVECDVVIPVARQEATGGTDLCIECASMLRG